jgi:hypothetical protein
MTDDAGEPPMTRTSPPEPPLRQRRQPRAQPSRSARCRIYLASRERSARIVGPSVGKIDGLDAQAIDTRKSLLLHGVFDALLDVCNGAL